MKSQQDLMIKSYMETADIYQLFALGYAILYTVFFQKEFVFLYQIDIHDMK